MESSTLSRCDLSVRMGGRKGRRTFLVVLQPCRLIQRDVPPGCLQTLFLSLLTQGFCICCSFCLSELPSHETSSVPLQLSVHSRLLQGNSPCPLDHIHSPYLRYHSIILCVVLLMVKYSIYLCVSLIKVSFPRMSLKSLRAGIVPAFASAWHR